MDWLDYIEFEVNGQTEETENEEFVCCAKGRGHVRGRRVPRLPLKATLQRMMELRTNQPPPPVNPPAGNMGAPPRFPMTFNNNMPPNTAAPPQFNNKFNAHSFTLQGLRPQMIISNMMRPAVLPVSFPNPIQRPVGGVQPTPRQQRPPVRPSSTPPVTAVGMPISQSVKLKQRQALLAPTQSFLNHENKQRVKSKAEVSAKEEKTTPESQESCK